MVDRLPPEPDPTRRRTPRMLAALDTSMVGWPKVGTTAGSNTSPLVHPAQQRRHDQLAAGPVLAEGAFHTRSRDRAPVHPQPVGGGKAPDLGEPSDSRSLGGTRTIGAPIRGASEKSGPAVEAAAPGLSELEVLRAQVAQYQLALQRAGIHVPHAHGNGPINAHRLGEHSGVPPVRPVEREQVYRREHVGVSAQVPTLAAGMRLRVQKSTAEEGGAVTREGHGAYPRLQAGERDVGLVLLSNRQQNATLKEQKCQVTSGIVDKPSKCRHPSHRTS